MPTLSQYNHFAGRHWESGTVHNSLAYSQAVAPHTGAPYSEALLLGVSGGIVMGYFTFAYKGFDPQVNILTRNTFDPWLTMLSRLGVVQNVLQTQNGQRAEEQLRAALDDGTPAIVLADMWSLPYNALPADGMWGAFPILVYGVEGDRVQIADRASVPLQVTPAALAAARGRIKKNRHRLITLEPPLPDKLPAAVSLGLSDCLRLFTEKPPKGAAHNFGLAAYRHWAEMLTSPKKRNSWAKSYSTDGQLYAALASAMYFALLFGKGEALDGERGLYADFLDEAALILNRPVLREAGTQFRAAGAHWAALGQALLPENVPLLAETRRLQTTRHRAFLQRGGRALDEMTAIDARLAEVRAQAQEALGLDDARREALLAQVAAVLLRIHDAEAQALAIMGDALAG